MKTFSSLRYVTSQSFSRRISSMQKSIACHQFNLMKDKHTINLILISSRWFNSFLPEIVHDEVILGSSVHLFFPELVIISHSRFERLHLSFQSSKLSQLSRREAPSKSLQGFTLCFQLLFLSIILLLPEFFMEALHGGSSRILFILQLFFKIFSRSYDLPSFTLK